MIWVGEEIKNIPLTRSASRLKPVKAPKRKMQVNPTDCKPIDSAESAFEGAWPNTCVLADLAKEMLKVYL